MENAIITTRMKPRRLWIAMFLTLLQPGLGQLYCGKFAKGIILFVASALTGVVCAFASISVEDSFRFFSLGTFVISILIFVYAMIDAMWLVKKTPLDYVLKDYNRWYVYFLLFILEIPLGISFALNVRQGMFEAFFIPSNSMYPTISMGERMIADKTVYKNSAIQRGDVIVFLNPNKRHQKNIKRVVALAGDTVEIRNNRLIINDKKLDLVYVKETISKDKDYLSGVICKESSKLREYQILLSIFPAKASQTGKQAKGANYSKITIPNGHCFVLGDNRNNSEDSRNYGPVPLRDIIGRIDYLYFPKFVNLKETENQQKK